MVRSNISSDLDSSFMSFLHKYHFLILIDQEDRERLFKKKVFSKLINIANIALSYHHFIKQ